MKLQKAILESFKRRFDDDAYVEEKASKIGSMSLLEAMRYLGEIDEQGMEIIADLTQYTVEELRFIQEFAINQS